MKPLLLLLAVFALVLACAPVAGEEPVLNVAPHTAFPTPSIYSTTQTPGLTGTTGIPGTTYQPIATPSPTSSPINPTLILGGITLAALALSASARRR